MLTEEQLHERHALWDEFLAAWPPERLRTMRLEEYTNLAREDSLTYWVEAKTADLGSIWGMTAFKFGIYRRQDREPKESNTTFTYGDEYAWWSRFGKTVDEAWETVQTAVDGVARAAWVGDLETIDEIDLTPMFKWKLAFLYQDRTKPTVFPIFATKPLVALYQRHVDPAANKRTQRSVLYATLRDRFSQISDPVQLGHHLWKLHESQTSERRAWVLDVEHALSTAEAKALAARPSVETEAVPPILLQWFDREEQVSAGDRLALVVDGAVRSRGTLEEVGEGQVAWQQVPCDVRWTGDPLPPGLVRLTERMEAALWRDPQGGAKPPVTGPPEPPLPRPQNIILYGPPGTGKTFTTARRALRLILGDEAVASLTEQTIAAQFRQLQQDGRIEMVTFHQSYGYEEFVEGLRPVRDAAGGGDVRYEIYPGVFKRIALRAATAGFRASAEEPSFATLWTELLRRVREDEDRVLESASGREYVLRVTPHDNFESHALDRDDGGEVIVTEKRQVASRSLVELWWSHRMDLGRPEEVSYERAKELIARERANSGGHHYTAIWIVYRELLALRDELVAARTSARPTTAQIQEALDRAAPGRMDFSFTGKTAQHVLIIDEVNRGNVSKILGELITLLEPDKRLGMPNELKLPLAYTPTHRFAVPPNLHVLATMNTADRSIALMDVALRRRFQFEEVMPDSEVLRAVLAKKVDDEAFVELVVDVLETLNARIRFLYDRDHQLGHAYFIEATSHAELRRVLTDRVVPLLQEYFYGAWDKIAAVLGCPYDENGRPLRQGAVRKDNAYAAPVVRATTVSERAVLGFDHDEYEDAIEYAVDVRLANASRPADVLPFALGVLELSDEDRATRRAALQAGSLFTAAE